ncbi:MAG TPA: pyridoxamine 5'-phosphate oxidase family protein [Acidimicrobiales bacterium]|nr:pyridoxamine 5'-phosphate oxidase family protein [Acidimicrobiales bacterium]
MPDSTTPIFIDEELAATIDGAFENKRPITVAYVDWDGQPHLSFRGSTQVHSPDQCAIWIREREGGLVRAIPHNPRITMMYRDSSTRTTYLIYGRARVETDSQISKLIYDKTPKGERDRDPDMAGVAVIIDVDAIQGGPPDSRVNMRRTNRE